MTNEQNARSSIVGFLAVLLLSAATMLWMFWHHPVSTGIVTLLILAALGTSAKLARQIDVESVVDIDAEHRL